MGKYEQIKENLEYNREVLDAQKDNLKKLTSEGASLFAAEKRSLGYMIDEAGNLISGSFLFSLDELNVQIGRFESAFPPQHDPWAALFFAERAASLKTADRLSSWRRELISALNSVEAIINATIGFRKSGVRVKNK